ncbi:MAG TPA: GH25 family lysozyme [Rhizomicrobium sp.]|nr:GH25 family lysozyme [Rhizomicrobium sp.]
MTILLSGLAAAALAGFLIAYLGSGPRRPISPERRLFSARGIDVSHHQGTIDWARLPAQKVRFVYLKASEGADWIDPVFARNLAAAPSHRIALGAYHYFTLCASGAAQAANFLRAVSAVRALSLPPAVDLEFVGNCAARPPRARLIRELDVFAASVRAATGGELVLYVSRPFFEQYISNTPFAAAPLWVRNLPGETAFARGRRVIIRQFASQARVQGVAGPVDVDLFADSDEVYGRLFAGGAGRLAPPTE